MKGPADCRGCGLSVERFDQHECETCGEGPLCASCYEDDHSDGECGEPDDAFGPWVGVPRERQRLCAVEGCDAPGEEHRCPWDGSIHHHGCVHYECVAARGTVELPAGEEAEGGGEAVSEKLDLDEIEKLERADREHEPGAWFVEDESDEYGQLFRLFMPELNYGMGRTKARLLAALRNAAPLLLQRARDADMLAARVEKLEAALRHAIEWLDMEGCDCGTDEPGTCALCEARAALSEEPTNG